VKKKTVFYGGISMGRSKYKAEDKLRIARACLAGEIGCGQAGEQIGADVSMVRDWIRQYQTEGIAAFLPREGNRRYDPIIKEAAVKDYLSGKGSLRDICRKYNIRDKIQLRTWIKVYNGHKDFKKQTGGSRMTKGRETTQAERIAVAKACIANGKNYGEIAIAYNVSYQQARSWTLKYIEGGESALEDRRGQRKKDQQPRSELEQAQIEIEQLKHKLKMLEMENHLLKKLEEIERRRG
jgi:transposase-like protein